MITLSDFTLFLCVCLFGGQKLQRNILWLSSHWRICEKVKEMLTMVVLKTLLLYSLQCVARFGICDDMQLKC